MSEVFQVPNDDTNLIEIVEPNGGATLGGFGPTGIPFGNCAQGSGGLSGMTANQIPVAATATTVTSSVPTTGTGNVVLSTSPTLTSPALGTPSSLALTNANNLPIGGINASGSPSSSTFLRGDGSWATPGTTGSGSPITTPSPFLFGTSSNTVDMQFSGPNPFVDVRTYNVRAMNPSSAPAKTGITANCTASNATISISAASSFQNGDGVCIFAAGATHSLSTPGAPTVTPSIASAATGTGYVVNGSSSGATAYQYQVVWTNQAGGLTAASTAGTTSTGASSLGSQNFSITSCSRTNNTVTVTCTGHGLTSASVGAMVLITGTSDRPNFDGWFNVQSVTNANTFVLQPSKLDSRNGASTSSTGGTLYYWNCNHVALPTPGTGVWQAYVYGRTSGSMVLLGVSGPVISSLSSDPTYMVFDDYGSTMTANCSLPAWVPTTPPGSATANNLVTTISSGAGTTTLVLTNAPSQNISTTPILYDSTPNFIAAVTAATTGTIYFPSTTATNTSYVFNSFCDISSLGIKAISQAGQVSLNHTMRLATGTQWHGDLTPNLLQLPSFGIESHIPLLIGTANPGIVISNGTFRGLYFENTAANMYNSLFIGPGGIPTGLIENCTFSGGGASDFMGVHVIMWAQSSAGGAAGFTYNECMFSSGPTQVDGSTATPLFICKQFGEMNFNGIMANRRGFFFAPNSAGLSLDWNMKYEVQGNITPLLIFTVPSGNASGWLRCAGAIIDTSPHAILYHAAYTGTYNPAEVIIVGCENPLQGIVTGYGFPNISAFGVTGPNAIGANTGIVSSAYATIGDGIFASGGNGASQGLMSANKHIALGTSNSLFTNTTQPAAPTVAVVSAGPPYSKAGTNQTYSYCAVFANGGVGPQSAASSTATTDGTSQQATISIPAAIPGAVGYFYYGGGILMAGLQTGLSLLVPASFVGAGALAAGGGPAGIQGSKVWANTIQITSTAFASLGSPANGSMVFCSDCVGGSNTTCSGSGSGTLAVRANNSWRCL